MRVTGGNLKGHILKAPSGMSTRPTPGRVREALFSILGPLESDLTFFDLYAGSGAAGIEALSRGADRAVFVEPTHKALTVLRQNLRHLNLTRQSEIHAAKLPAWLDTEDFTPSDPCVLFLDPPYEKGLAAKTIEALAQKTSGLAASVCVAQTEKRLEMPENWGTWTLRKAYRYGDTVLWVYDPA